MPAPLTQQARDEFAAQGHALYVRAVVPKLRPEDDGKFVAVDVDSGEYEIDQDDHAVIHRLLERRPAARIWLECAGQPGAYRFSAGRGA